MSVVRVITARDEVRSLIETSAEYQKAMIFDPMFAAAADMIATHQADQTVAILLRCLYDSGVSFQRVADRLAEVVSK